MSTADTRVGGLEVLHDRLGAHFGALHARRRHDAPGSPLFVLEHGLTDAELALLRAEVISAVQRGRLPRTAWLPVVVYAAEIGYEYCGDEYWQTFEAKTPGWTELGPGARDYVRARFRRFRDEFGGAEPQGAWAEWFTIICWPITHAILPTVLQRQLARLLFEYRTGFTADLLADPGALGVRLSARSGNYSARFQVFAQNTQLLGQVAAALLSGDEDESPYLLRSTLHRIVQSLTTEREARLWLKDAKSRANQVRMRGFRPTARQPTPERPPMKQRLPAATDPTIFLRLRPSGWAAYLNLPDLSVLAERLPDIHEGLGRLRAKISGATRAPLARRQLLLPGQEIRLDTWPDPRTPLIQLEGGSDAINRLLSDQCVLSPGPWLFRVRDKYLATEVRGNFVRPDRQYILLAARELGPDLPQWAARIPCETSGVTAYAIDVPAAIGSDQVATLRSLGVGVITDVVVRPVGLVPGRWDGEGEAEWLTGEAVLVGIRSTRPTSQCIVTLDGIPKLIDWPGPAHEVFICFSEVTAGPHEVTVALLPESADDSVVEGQLLLVVRSPHAHPASGTFREALMILSAPARPSLSELWEGRATIEVAGPEAARASVDFLLQDSSNRALVQHRSGVVLPITSEAWSTLVNREIRGREEMRHHYDDAESAIITVRSSGLGTATLRCDREFTPLRWASGRAKDRAFARLIDNTEGGGTEVVRYTFAAPTFPLPIASAPALLDFPDGGLLRATSRACEASVILPPRDFLHLQPAGCRPVIPVPPRTPESVTSLITVAGIWRSATLPADPFAEHERRTVQLAMTASITSLIAGARWTHLEDRWFRAEDYPVRDFADAVGLEDYQKSLATDLQSVIPTWTPFDNEKRVAALAELLARRVQPPRPRRTPPPKAWGGLARRGAEVLVQNPLNETNPYGDPRLSEFLLKITSDPASLHDWSQEDLQSLIELALVSPVIVRAARLAVLGVVSEWTAKGHEGEAWLWS